MRGKSSPKQGMEKDDLSGAYYIRTLVKQLATSSRNKLNPPLNSAENRDVFVEKEEPKKKVRRRFHANKPYQEKLLNMAEARKEIVTALKFHRASMKNHHQQPQPPMAESNYPWPPLSPIAPPPIENLHLSLSNQLPLGLKLNFHDFNVIDNSSIYSSTSSPCLSTSSSSSSSPPLSFPISGINQQVMNIDSGLHNLMEEIRSVGEQHQIKWNETVNLVSSALWFKFLKSMEIEKEENNSEEDYGHFPFDEINVVEFPSWLNSNENESSFLEDYCFDDYFSQHYMQDGALPCMEIEEIEGMDEEWLSSS